MEKKLILTEDHRYFLDGQEIPGCSAILKSCGLCDYSFVPENVLQAAADFGIAAHRACELSDKGILDADTLDIALAPYLAGYKQFLSDFKPLVNPDYIETSLYSAKYNFACTPDRVVSVKNKIWVLEIKTTSTILPTVALQLAAQKIAVEENLGKIHRRVVIQLTEAGYKLFPCDDQADEPVFLACLKLYNWKGRHE